MLKQYVKFDSVKIPEGVRYFVEAHIPLRRHTPPIHEHTCLYNHLITQFYHPIEFQLFSVFTTTTFQSLTQYKTMLIV